MCELLPSRYFLCTGYISGWISCYCPWGVREVPSGPTDSEWKHTISWIRNVNMLRFRITHDKAVWMLSRSPKVALRGVPRTRDNMHLFQSTHQQAAWRVSRSSKVALRGFHLRNLLNPSESFWWSWAWIHWKTNYFVIWSPDSLENNIFGGLESPIIEPQTFSATVLCWDDIF